VVAAKLWNISGAAILWTPAAMPRKRARARGSLSNSAGKLFGHRAGELFDIGDRHRAL
jgi:hypothetical protein